MKKIILPAIFLATLAMLFSFIQQPKTTVYMIGDSTMANKKQSAYPETGWGQAFQQFFTDDVVIANRAVNGRSSLSFMGENRWQPILDSIRPGDYVIIQFGHNDSKTDSSKHTEPFTTFKANLKKYIDDTRAKGANPILCTSIVRRHFTDDGQLKDTHGDYIVATRQVAAEMNVPLIDLEARTRALVSELGPEKSKSLYLFAAPGQYPNRPKGVKDSTHLCVDGATRVAGLAADAIRELNIPLASKLKTKK
jgi:pectinesterase